MGIEERDWYREEWERKRKENKSEYNKFHNKDDDFEEIEFRRYDGPIISSWNNEPGCLMRLAKGAFWVLALYGALQMCATCSSYDARYKYEQQKQQNEQNIVPNTSTKQITIDRIF